MQSVRLEIIVSSEKCKIRLSDLERERKESSAKGENRLDTRRLCREQNAFVRVSIPFMLCVRTSQLAGGLYVMRVSCEARVVYKNVNGAETRCVLVNE